MHWFAAIAVVVIHAAVEAQRLLGPGQGFAGAEVGGALVVESVVVALIVSYC